jgi:hypothetical protein
MPLCRHFGTKISFNPIVDIPHGTYKNDNKWKSQKLFSFLLEAKN